RGLSTQDVSSQVPFSSVWPPLRNLASTNVDAPPPTCSPPHENDFAVEPPAPPRLSVPQAPTGAVLVSVEATFAPKPHELAGDERATIWTPLPGSKFREATHGSGTAAPGPPVQSGTATPLRKTMIAFGDRSPTNVASSRKLSTSGEAG